MIIDVYYISVWNGGFEVVTNAKYNQNTKEVFDIQGYDGELIDEYGDELEFLDGQFIELQDGSRIEVNEIQDKYIAVD